MTIEQRLQQLLGAQAFQIASLLAQIDQLQAAQKPAEAAAAEPAEAPPHAE